MPSDAVARALIAASPGPVVDNDPLRNAVRPMSNYMTAQAQKGWGQRLADVFGPRRDEQGNPQPASIRDYVGASLMALPMYHGSPVRGMATIRPSTRGPLGPGVYASPNDQVAGRYGGNLYEVAPGKQKEVFNGLGDRYGSFEAWKADKAKLLAAAPESERAAIGQMLDKSWTNDGYSLYWDLRNFYKGDAGAQNLLRKAGFEGFGAYVDGPEIVLFEHQPAQAAR